MHDFLALFQHRQLIFSDRNGSCMECGDVCCLTDRVAEKAYWDTGFKVPLLNLCLNGRVPLYAGNGNQIHVIERQFCQLRYHGLNENGAFFRIQTTCQIVQSHLCNVLSYFFRMLCIICQCLCIGDHNINFVEFSGVLQFYPFFQGTYVMSYMQPSGGTISGQNNLFHVFAPYDSWTLRQCCMPCPCKFLFLL